MRYPNNLREARDARRLAQWEVCRVVGIGPDRYGRLELGKTEPSYGEAVRLATYFSVPAAVLFPPVAEHARAS